MTWNGLWIYDGTPIINSELTEGLIATRGEAWFTALPELDTDDTVWRIQGDAVPYTEYEDFDTPWWDSDNPISGDFYGAYPLDVQGIESSTRSSSPFESVGEGGTPGRVRHGIRTLVFQVALMADSDEANAYGLAWLRRALLGGFCSDSLTTKISTGLNLDYLASRPVLDVDRGYTVAERRVALARHLHKVTFSAGPTEPQKRNLSCGGSVWVTTFTATVGNPFELGYEQEIFTNMPNAVTYSPGVTPGTGSGPTAYTEVGCSESVLDPLYDPLCPPFIEPPSPPTIGLGCYTIPATWARYQTTIPASEVPTWGQVVPIVDVFTTVEQRGIRIRFYNDFNSDGTTGDDPCNYVGDMLISYIPAGQTLQINAVDEEVTITDPSGNTRAADSLVFGTDFKPFQWPSLTCGSQWIFVADFDDVGGAVARPIISLSLTPRVV